MPKHITVSITESKKRFTWIVRNCGRQRKCHKETAIIAGIDSHSGNYPVIG
jgi:hypothetical protein